MALFGSDKEEKASLSKKVRPTVIRTQNVAKELQKIAMSYEMKPEALDFNLLEVQTFTRITESKSEVEFKELDAAELYELDLEASMLNPNFEIKQVYEVEIFSKDMHNDPFADFHIAVGANATKCKVYLSIKQGAKVSFYPRFEKELLSLINKSKIRAGILINVFDEMLSAAVAKIAAHVRIEEHVTYAQNETILIAQSFEPTPTLDDALIMHYEKKSEHGINDVKKVDYAARSFIQSVHEDQLLIEYIKAQPGKPGRNCRGEYMAPKEPEINHEPTFEVDSTIKVIETDTNIEYRAKENGYIAFEENKYLIKTEVDVGEISFKTTGSISTGLDSDVSISVKETDAIKDAIGTGMQVEVSEINIDGNVGSNAKVHALKASIGGQTHKTAFIQADELDINVHKGKAKGKNVHITRLEHGEVEGEIVEISQALGGRIYAREITIQVCGSYVKATASRRIEIHKLHGSENIFTIDPLLKEDAAEGFSENEEGIKKLESDLKSLQQEIDKLKAYIQNNTEAFNDLKRRLIHYKKNGVKLPETFVKKYQQFQKTTEHLKHIQDEHHRKENQHTLLTTKTASFQDSIFDARIINHERWIGHNEIRVKMVEPPIELSYVVPEGSEDKIFGLVELNEGEYMIRAVKE